MARSATSEPFLFRRPALAAQLAEALVGGGIFDLSSGLFLASPRRTGKSTFLTADLTPALEARGVLTVYADLWSERERDPAELVIEAIRTAADGAAGWSKRMAARVKVERVTVPGMFEVDFAKLGARDGPTFTGALRALAARASGSVALIVDEAQQAIASDAGANMMFALKSARDSFNMGAADDGARQRLLLVFTGSNRDRLADLVMKREQPFFGATLQEFPRLGPDYAAAFAAWMNSRLASGQRFAVDDVARSFDIVGARPEWLREAVQEALLGAGVEDLVARAVAVRERRWATYAIAFDELTPLQRALVEQLAAQGERYAPFNAASIAAYTASTGKGVTVGGAQRALDALRARGLVWRSMRGIYAFEDAEFADWLRARRAAGAPPSP